MKNITKFIKESYDNIRLNDVTVKYNIIPDEIYIQAPDTFQESDIQQYLDDKFLINLPSGVDYAETFFGENAENIYDAYFEYDSFEHLPEDKKVSGYIIEWDDKFNTNKDGDINLNYFKITKLNYIISFDRFDIMDEEDSEDNIHNVLSLIFNATVSNAQNKYPLEIKLKDENITFKK